MTESYFLWPDYKISRVLKSLHRQTSIIEVEARLESLFPSGVPVLCSSARSALVVALIQSHVSRNDLVGVFPFASHCVLDAISRVATPLSGPDAIDSNLRVVYHQWGFVQDKKLNSYTIEDCVDTLCIPGADLFPGGGRYEIWSLPKILGVSSGGVLWCRDQETADRARHCRDQRGGGIFPYLIRLFSKLNPNAYLYWQGVEGHLGRMSRIQTGDIAASIDKWEKIVADRIEKLNVTWPYALNCLEKPIHRLPPVVPIVDEKKMVDCYELGISSGVRTIELIDESGERELKKVIPVPIHQDVSKSWLKKTLSMINCE